MTDATLCDVLRMPPQIWSGSQFDEESRHKMYVEAAGELERCAAEISRLHEIVDRLPKTADGVPITPAMVLYDSENGRECIVTGIRNGEAFTNAPVYGDRYSTRDAAEKARQSCG